MNIKKITIKDYDTFYFLSDGTYILSIQQNQWDKERFDVSSIHKPNQRTGTGFRLIESVGSEEINADFWNKYAHIHAPNWATVLDCEHSIKYKNLAEWLEYEKKFYNESDIHISEIELSEPRPKLYALENRKIAILRAIYKIQNFMDCDVLGEANIDIETASDIKETIAGTEYALSAINYRRNDRPDADIQQVYADNIAIIKNMLAELKAL